MGSRNNPTGPTVLTSAPTPTSSYDAWNPPAVSRSRRTETCGASSSQDRSPTNPLLHDPLKFSLWKSIWRQWSTPTTFPVYPYNISGLPLQHFRSTLATSHPQTYVNTEFNFPEQKRTEGTEEQILFPVRYWPLTSLAPRHRRRFTRGQSSVLSYNLMIKWKA